MLVRVKDGENKRDEAVELLRELYRIPKGRFDLLLMAYWSYGG